MTYFAEAHFLQNLARAVHMTCCEFDAPQFCKKEVIYSMNIENVSNTYLTDVFKQKARILWLTQITWTIWQAFKIRSSIFPNRPRGAAHQSMPQLLCSTS